MKRLWKVIPPCYSDVLGFEAVLNATEGLGIIDDPSHYKPITQGKANQTDRGSFFGGHRPEYLRADTAGYERSGMWEGRKSHSGPFGGRGGQGTGELRVVNSDIRNADIITGTEKKVLTSFEANRWMNPTFVLLCHAPSSSMIGSDLEANASQIQEIGNLPAAYVNVDGGKDYLYGISMTLEAMGKLLLERQETIPGSINLLGCNTIDWTEEMRRSTEKWLSDHGFRVLSCWGMKESTETLKGAAAAEKNLVVSVAGLRLARYMEAEFGIPYVVGAPFGVQSCEMILKSLRDSNETPDHHTADEPSVLIVGEQYTANAIREALLARGYHGIRVVSFYDVDKASMEPGDGKMTSEEDLEKQLQAPSLQLVFCNPDMQPLLNRDLAWVKLPNPGAFSVYEAVERFNMVGNQLDLWLDKALEGEHRA